MNNTELQKILDEHKLWVNSMQESGSRAYLHGANLCGADLRGANLSGANLRGAYLYGAYLHDADLSGANLCDAKLRDAKLHGANLRDADLCGADLYGAYLPDRTFVMIGEVYYLQITNGEYIKVGCQSHTVSQWRSFNKRDIAEMDGRKALNFYPRLLDIIDLCLGQGERPEWLNEPDLETEVSTAVEV